MSCDRCGCDYSDFCTCSDDKMDKRLEVLELAVKTILEILQK